ncbi:MAG: hypothetical protein K5686_07105 [Lachnospiraceae bacterium]|nr:hypothetical protein [Lachnospiraceae bacterium]
MENKETTFYLGEKKTETVIDKNPYQEKTVISYGGEMPLVFSNEEYVPLTNDEVENKRILSDMLEKKNMINKRMLYLENKRMELLGYYMKIEKDDKGRSVRGLAKFMLVFTGAAATLMLSVIDKEKAILSAGFFIFLGLVIFIRTREERTEEKLSDLDRKVEEMEREHEKLEKEKEKLQEKIKLFKKEGHI